MPRRETSGAVIERDVSLHLACDACGAEPPGRSTALIRRHRTTRPDPESVGLEIVLCDRCAQADPGRVAELVQLRRAWYVVAWKSGIRPTA